MKQIISLLALLLLPFAAKAQVPTVDPICVYVSVDEDGKEKVDTLMAGAAENPLSAPGHATFIANPSNYEDDYKPDVWYEWTIWRTDDPSNILLRRNAEVTEFDFVESGSYAVQLKAMFYDINGNTAFDYEFPQEDEDKKLITFTVSDSKLEFPNAFSPNGDGRNDILRAKRNYKSIVEFHAAVFNRWGTRIYSWDNVAEGWDGKQGGRTVKDGVYFLVVKAKGGDGVQYNFKKAITVLTSYDSERERTAGAEE